MSRCIFTFLVLIPVISFAETSVKLLDESPDQAVTVSAKVKFVINVKERLSLEIKENADKSKKMTVDSNIPGLVIDNETNTIAIP